MRRREFIALLGGTMAGARASLAQARISKVGVLMTNAQDREGQLRFDAIREGLAKLGWREGESIHLEARWAPTGNSQLIRKYAEELVALRPDVLVAHNTPGVMAVLEL